MSVEVEAVVGAARAWLGTPYRHRAATLGAGCDCLGLIRGVWRMLYGDEPGPVPNYRADGRDGAGLLEAAERYLERAEGIASGRVVLFRLGRHIAPRHCGIMVTPTRFVHAQERLGVVEGNLTEGWRKRVVGVFDFPQRPFLPRASHGRGPRLHF
jgi:NlpC/P60 family putative phage cell wall peptidase